MSTDTPISNLVINKLTKAQYESITPSNTELYFITDDDTYQEKLVSGTSIKTINNESVLGSGDLVVSGLPSQSGQSGKFLTTNGTTASWATVETGSTYYAGNNINFTDAKISGTLATNTSMATSVMTLTSTSDTGLTLPSTLTALDNTSISTFVLHLKIETPVYSSYSSTQRYFSLFGGWIYAANGQSAVGAYGSSYPRFTTAGIGYIKVEKTSTSITVYYSTDDSTWTAAATTTNLQSSSKSGVWYLGAPADSGKVSYSGMKFYLDECYLTVDGTEVWRGYDSSKSGSIINAYGFLQNTAAESTSLTIAGTASTTGYSTNIGVGSSANSMGTSLGYSCGASGSPSVAIGRMVYATQSNTIGIGNMAHAYGSSGIAIGTQAEAASGTTGAIQIGPGTNSNTATLSIGLYDGSTSNNYQLLNSSGNIPPARLGEAIQLVTELPASPVAGVLYLIAE